MRLTFLGHPLAQVTLAWMALVAAIQAASALGNGFWAANLLYGPVILFLPLLFVARERLGLRPVRWRESIVLFALLAGVTLAPALLVGRPVAPTHFAATFVMQTLMVALPEEFFFRGFVQGRLTLLSRKRIHLAGAEIGWECPLTALLFALSHVVLHGPSGLRTFFPGLVFGWAYARNGSIWAGTLYHGLCNALAATVLLG